MPRKTKRRSGTKKRGAARFMTRHKFNELFVDILRGHDMTDAYAAYKRMGIKAFILKISELHEVPVEEIHDMLEAQD